MVVKIRLTAPWAVRCCAAVESLVRIQRTAIPLRARWLVAAAGLVMCGTSTADFPVMLMKPVAAAGPKSDPRVARLKKLFRIYHCPEPHHIPEYLRAADGYGLDYRLLPAVSIRESLCGVEEVQNNRWGYHPGRQTFPSVAVGIDYVARQLAENPLYRGKTLEGKLFTYNPRVAYPGEVQRIMQRAE